VSGVVIALNVSGESIAARQSDMPDGAETLSLASDNSIGLQLDERLAAAIGIMRIRALRGGTPVRGIMVTSRVEAQAMLALDGLRLNSEPIQWMDTTVAQLAALRATHQIPESGSTLHVDVTKTEATLRAVDAGSTESRIVAQAPLNSQDIPASAFGLFANQLDIHTRSLIAVVGDAGVTEPLIAHLRELTTVPVVHVPNGVDLALVGALAQAPTMELTRSGPRHAAHAAPGAPSRTAIFPRGGPEKRSRGARRRRA